MKKLVKYMIIIFIIIIILIFILLFLINQNKNSGRNLNQEEKIDADAFEIKPQEELLKVESTQLVFNIKNCIQYYIDYINDNNYDAVLKVLDKNYVRDINITENNIKQNSTKFLKSFIWINEIYQKENTNEQSIYFIKGNVLDINTYEYKEELNFTVIIDDANQAFAVIPEIINDENYNYNLTIQYDDENYYNEYIYKNYSEVEIFTEYFNYYKELAINNPEFAFSLLDKDYKEKRFNNSLEIYEEYLSDIDINNVYPDKITVNFNEDSKEYVCIDKKGLYYIFDEISPLVFSLKLDTYTLTSNKFIETYDSSTEDKKVSMNIDKWLNMIRNKDYYNAYNILDETFRGNNFGNVENFKEYVKQNYNDNFTYDFGKVDKYNEIYSQTLNFKIEDQEITKTFIVKLENDRKFILSFEI